MENPTGFAHVHLSEIDPTFRPVAERFYDLKIYKATHGTYTTAAGKSGEYVKFQLAIVNDAEYTGRRLFPTLFFGPRELRTLRKLQDNTAVVQEPGEPFLNWLERLSQVQPTFRTKVLQVPSDERGNPIHPKSKNPPKPLLDGDGNPVPVNLVDWNEIIPASSV